MEFFIYGGYVSAISKSMLDHPFLLGYCLSLHFNFVIVMQFVTVVMKHDKGVNR